MKAAAAATTEDRTAAVWRDLETLTAWGKNPRINDHVVDDVANSIIRFGWGNPLLAREQNGELIAGHTRVKGAYRIIERWTAATDAQRATWSDPSSPASDRWSADALRVAQRREAPTRTMSLDEANAHLHALADNRLAEKADWDNEVLLDVLDGFEIPEIEVAGWSEAELDEIKNELRKRADKDQELVEDEPPPVPDDPVTKPGDLWILGRHRLLCADSTLPESYARLLDGRKVGLMVTDPPYGVNAVVGTTDPRARARNPALKRGGRATYKRDVDADAPPIANDDLEGAKLAGFLRSACVAMAPSLAPGAAWYIWFAGSNAMEFMQASEELGGFRHQLVWVKPHFVFGRSDYHYRHEPCLYGWTPGAAHTWLGDRSQTSVFEMARDKAVGSSVHPSVKPVELYAIPVRNHLGADGAVLDPFAGTGPAYSAAEQLGRACYGLELDPGYCDVIVQRWEALTGQKAVREPA